MHARSIAQNLEGHSLSSLSVAESLRFVIALTASPQPSPVLPKRISNCQLRAERMSRPWTLWQSTFNAFPRNQHILESAQAVIYRQIRRLRCLTEPRGVPEKLCSRHISFRVDSVSPITDAAAPSGFYTHVLDSSTTTRSRIDTIHGNPSATTYSKSTTTDRVELPVLCPGCGALTQNVDPSEAGYYNPTRKSIKAYLRALRQNAHIEAVKLQEGQVEDHDLQVVTADNPQGKPQESGSSESTPAFPVDLGLPICDRCHNLLHSSQGISIAHPSVEAIADIIAESPYRRNHVYHVLDAADFPMSLIPSIHRSLSLAKPRSKNRRSQHDFSRKPTLDIIITRSDLLAPSKALVDSLMPYFTTVLREALGRRGDDMRLGNVHLVSAKRGWWTKEVKEAIWRRGGGNWMVGKVNVGKSNLFEVLFPKGSDEHKPSYTELSRAADADNAPTVDEKTLLNESSLLPYPPYQAQQHHPSASPSARQTTLRAN